MQLLEPPVKATSKKQLSTPKLELAVGRRLRRSPSAWSSRSGLVMGACRQQTADSTQPPSAVLLQKIWRGESESERGESFGVQQGWRSALKCIASFRNDASVNQLSKKGVRSKHPTAIYPSFLTVWLALAVCLSLVLEALARWRPWQSTALV